MLSVDKAGNYVGNVYLPRGSNLSSSSSDLTSSSSNLTSSSSNLSSSPSSLTSSSLAVRLLRVGAVFVNDKALPFCSDADAAALLEAEEAARAERRGCWAAWREPEEPREQAVAGEMECTVTCVETGNAFCVQTAADEATRLRVAGVLAGLPIPVGGEAELRGRTTVRCWRRGLARFTAGCAGRSGSAGNEAEGVSA